MSARLPQKLVTVRRQTKAVIGYATAVQSEFEQFGIIGETKESVGRFIEANFPHVSYDKRKTKRAVWISAGRVTTLKAMKDKP